MTTDTMRAIRTWLAANPGQPLRCHYVKRGVPTPVSLTVSQHAARFQSGRYTPTPHSRLSPDQLITALSGAMRYR